MRGHEAAVGIVGAGPAGLSLANILHRSGVECVVYERLTEEEVRTRARAGMIEDRTVRILDAHGLADGLRSRASTVGACEFRSDGNRHILDYAALCGAAHRVYPQQLLVGDLIDCLRARGGDVRFDSRVMEVGGGSESATIVTDRDTAVFDVVVGCDGFHGVCRPAMPAVKCASVDFGAEWLTILAAAPPSSEHTVYGLHADGFAGQFHRSPTVSRLMLQVRPGTSPDEWDDEAIWARLECRLAVGAGDDDRTLTTGPIIEKSVMQLRSAVAEPMQQGRIVLAGDAAHIVTPAGGKGMNLAIQDTEELARALVDHFIRGDDRRLDAYTTTRLPQVWRAVEFSHWMLQHLLLAPAGLPAEAAFHQGLRASRLARLMSGGPMAMDFARCYVGEF